MGLSSIFCCSVDTKDESDENKYRANNKNNNSKAYTTPTMNNNKEVNSVHTDTETVTNTNEDNNNPQTNNSSETTEGSSKKVDYKTDEVVIAQANGNEDLVDMDTDNLDEESLLELTKFQEGQYRNPETGWLLGKKDESKFHNKKCLILDLDETLVHSSFKYLRTADFVIPVEIENQIHHVYVIKRPGVDEFLKKVGEWYEVVVFTASVSKYGNPLLDKLDIHKSVHHRLFRDSCFNYEGNFIKNLSQIGRPLNESIIIDNSPASYIFHPQHSVPISSWFSDTHDNELLDLLPFLHDLSKQNVDDVSLVLDVLL